MKKLVLLIGLPGSGKDTQADLLEKNQKYHIVRIGEEVRMMAQKNPQLFSQEVHGNLADPKIVNNIVKNHLQKAQDDTKIVCDGYPRSMEQTLALEKMLEQYSFESVVAVYIELSKDEVLKRLSLRDREDDNKEAVLKRIEIFNTETQEVLDYYKNKQILKKVSGIGDVNEVHGRIVEAIQ